MPSACPCVDCRCPQGASTRPSSALGPRPPACPENPPCGRLVSRTWPGGPRVNVRAARQIGLWPSSSPSSAILARGFYLSRSLTPVGPRPEYRPAEQALPPCLAAGEPGAGRVRTGGHRRPARSACACSRRLERCACEHSGRRTPCPSFPARPFSKEKRGRGRPPTKNHTGAGQRGTPKHLMSRCSRGEPANSGAQFPRPRPPGGSSNLRSHGNLTLPITLLFSLTRLPRPPSFPYLRT